MAKKRRGAMLALVKRPAGPQIKDPTGETVGRMKDAIAAANSAVNAVKDANAVMVNAIAVECAKREGIDQSRWILDLDSLKWVERVQAPPAGSRK